MGGNDIIDRLAADPLIVDDIAAAEAQVEEMDRVYAMNLAMIRKAAQITQVEVARKLGVGQGVVSRLEEVLSDAVGKTLLHAAGLGQHAGKDLTAVLDHVGWIWLGHRSHLRSELEAARCGAVEAP